MLLIMTLKVVAIGMLKYVEVKIIQVRLRLIMNKMFYLGMSVMMMVWTLVKMMTMMVILMMNKISH